MRDPKLAHILVLIIFFSRYLGIYKQEYPHVGCRRLSRPFKVFFILKVHEKVHFFVAKLACVFSTEYASRKFK